jgi:uncharacterized membrane protein YcaP (DUF421 family)
VWHSIFHLTVSVGEKVLRSVLIYVFLVVALRFAGKRELGQTNTLDLAVLLLVANAVQNGIIGNDLSVTGAIIGAVVLFGLNALVTRGVFEFPWLERMVEGTPTVLIENGKPVRRALNRERISLADLRAIARRQGFPNLAAVHSAILETNGTISMFKQDEPGHYHPDDPLGPRIGKRRRPRIR